MGSHCNTFSFRTNFEFRGRQRDVICSSEISFEFELSDMSTSSDDSFEEVGDKGVGVSGDEGAEGKSADDDVDEGDEVGDKGNAKE